ncbi:HTH CENPB-type domain-containing protein [Nephila pilipes]|uniref:HTH CENPB-type domain-containing protein n=1 Tax=Nephila pilipes TaxID=299642 RepID=A0A8X6NJX0_NEPPI|nr:HTH CENPB-type domain-containing protein [Nephila pilipes]
MDWKKVCEKSSAKKKMMSIELKREIIEKHEQEKQLQGDTLTQTIICERARAIYRDLQKQIPQTSNEEASEESFKASRFRFENFKKLTSIHSVVRHGEAASSDMQEIGFEESEEEVISTSEIKEILGMWERVSQFVEKKHPEKVATGRASDLFNDTCLTPFRNILRGRKKQTSLDMFFSKRPTGESEKNVAKKAKTSEDI